MKTNPDGLATLYVQKDSPGKAKESNWLPAPDGQIYLVMQLYWPSGAQCDGHAVGRERERERGRGRAAWVGASPQRRRWALQPRRDIGSECVAVCGAQGGSGHPALALMAVLGPTPAGLGANGVHYTVVPAP